MTDQETIKLIQDTVSRLTSNATSPHRHNGVDSLPIPIGNILIVPNTGVPFTGPTNDIPAQTAQYNLYILSNFGSTPLILEPNDVLVSSATADFYIGKGTPYNGNVFTKILGFTNAALEASSPQVYFESSATDTGDVSSLQINPANVAITSNRLDLLASNAGTFAIQLPDVPRPLPVAGMIAFEGGTFFACEVTGTWRTIVTA